MNRLLITAELNDNPALILRAYWPKYAWTKHNHESSQEVVCPLWSKSKVNKPTMLFLSENLKYLKSSCGAKTPSQPKTNYLFPEEQCGLSFDTVDCTPSEGGTEGWLKLVPRLWVWFLTLVMQEHHNKSGLNWSHSENTEENYPSQFPKAMVTSSNFFFCSIKPKPEMYSVNNVKLLTFKQVLAEGVWH